MLTEEHSPERIEILLVGTKSDKTRAISYEEAEVNFRKFLY